VIATCVVDASVALAWVNPAQGTDATDELLTQLGVGMVVVVPPIWFPEVANALLALERRKKLTNVERINALDQLTALKVLMDEESARFVFTTTSEIATKHGLSVYDASYLEVALRRKLALATRDESLRQGAKRAGVKLVF
jgi:predicted nucleic acid-binding protein